MYVNISRMMPPMANCFDPPHSHLPVSSIVVASSILHSPLFHYYLPLSSPPTKHAEVGPICWRAPSRFRILNNKPTMPGCLHFHIPKGIGKLHLHYFPFSSFQCPHLYLCCHHFRYRIHLGRGNRAGHPGLGFRPFPIVIFSIPFFLPFLTFNIRSTFLAAKFSRSIGRICAPFGKDNSDPKAEVFAPLLRLDLLRHIPPFQLGIVLKFNSIWPFHLLFCTFS